MDPISSSGSPTSRVRKTPIRKTRTFNGCWTCRRRKVKCDLTRPVCTRCTKGGHHCDGYGLLLHWAENNFSFANDSFCPVRGNAVKRKAMVAPRFESWQLDMRRVSEILTELNEMDPVVDRVMGPFSVLQLHGDCHSSDTDQELANLPLRSESGANVLSVSSVQKCASGSPWQVLSQMQALPDVLSTNSAFPSAARLFHHYTRHVTHLLQPVLHSGNFYRAVYVPHAISGAWDLVRSDSALTASWSTRSIFFSILATAAFHLRGIDTPSGATVSSSRDLDRSIEMDSIGRSCRTMAYRYLRFALTKGFGTPDDMEAALSAILSFISIDIMHGSMTEFPLHLSAFRALQAQHQGQRESREGLAPDETTSPAERFLNTIFYLQSTLSQSTNYDITPVPWPSDPQSSLILQELSYTIGPIDDQCLQYTYGTTKRLTMFVRAVTALFWSVAYYTSTGAYFPDTLQLEMDSLSNGLNDWRLESEDIIDLPDVASTRVVKLHILAFYNAICIFRLTHLVLPLSTDDGTRSALFHEVSFYVSEVLSHLRSIERIKQQNPRAFDRQSASIMWPGFIAACEAPQQGREGWVEWWENMLAYRIGNIASLYETLRDVWNLRDRTQDDSYLLPAWRRLLREKRMVIIAL